MPSVYTQRRWLGVARHGDGCQMQHYSNFTGVAVRPAAFVGVYRQGAQLLYTLHCSRLQKLNIAISQSCRGVCVCVPRLVDGQRRHSPVSIIHRRLYVILA